MLTSHPMIILAKKKQLKNLVHSSTRLIIGHTDLEESSPEWTPVNTKKEYRCKDSIGDDSNRVHTKFFEYDRSRSSFEFYCLTNGSYDFHNDTHHWPVCYAGKDL